MIRLTLVVFLGCIALSTAQVHFPGPCPNLSVKANFDIERYLGLWYYQSSYPYVFQLSGKCQTVTYSLASDHRLGVDNRITDISTGEDRWKSGSGRIIDSGKFGLSFDSISPEEPRWVLDTDYENYTILYSCVDFSGFLHTKNVWIMTRDQFPKDDIMTRALAKINSLNLPAQYLLQNDQRGCGILLREAVPEKIPIW